MKAITKRLRTLRASAGLIQLQVADKAGMPVRRYNEIEKGHRPPKDEEIAAIAKALKVTPAEIVAAPQEASL